MPHVPPRLPARWMRSVEASPNARNAPGVSNSHEMSYRQALPLDALQARTNTTMRSLNRAVLVVVSPIAGLFADSLGFARLSAPRL